MFLDFVSKEISSISGWNLFSLSLMVVILCILIGILLYTWILENENKKIKLFISTILSPAIVLFVISLAYFFRYDDILSEYKVVSEKYNISREEFFKAYFNERERKKNRWIMERARLDKIEKSSEVSAARRIANKYGIR